MFAVSDAALAVSATGLVTAQATTAGSYATVILYDTISHRTHRDSVLIAVTARVNPPHIKTFSFGPLPGDAIISYPESKSFPVVVIDADGNPITPESDSLVVEYVSSEPNVASVDPQGNVTAHVPDREVVITARTTFYGVTKSSTMRLAVGYPISVDVQVCPRGGYPGSGMCTGLVVDRVFSPDTAWISNGGTIRFFALDANSRDYSVGGSPDDVIFEDLTGIVPAHHIDVMQVPAYGLGFEHAADCYNGKAHCFETRTFTNPGIYRYHSSLSGASGVIVVK